MKHQQKNNNTSCEVSAGGNMLSDTKAALSTKRYETPVLIAYGDVRDITLGGTLGLGESGAETFLRNS